MKGIDLALHGDRAYPASGYFEGWPEKGNSLLSLLLNEATAAANVPEGIELSAGTREAAEKEKEKGNVPICEPHGDRRIHRARSWTGRSGSGTRRRERERERENPVHMNERRCEQNVRGAQNRTLLPKQSNQANTKNNNAESVVNMDEPERREGPRPIHGNNSGRGSTTSLSSNTSAKFGTCTSSPLNSLDQATLQELKGLKNCDCRLRNATRLPTSAAVDCSL